jgi:hypothetical protein
MATSSTPVPGKYGFERVRSLEHLDGYMELLKKISHLVDEDKKVQEYLDRHLTKLKGELEKYTRRDTTEALQCYASFLPPRLVDACREGLLIPFFGSGISISAGIPTWNGLLQTLGIASDYISDPHVEHDPLTQAELVAHDIGTDSLQQRLREQMGHADRPSLAHYLLASLRLPVYITTNYDSLFETAWKQLWEDEDLLTITNDVDVIAHNLEPPKTFPTEVEGQKSILIKMHGDSTRKEGLLILTRSDYRRHYRSNVRFFELVKGVVQSGYVLFLGFGHRDPEVSRLVEDVVYKYEHEDGDGSSIVRDNGRSRRPQQKPPTLYSIQFDMRQKTPEVFAARGIVALRPPAIIHDFNANQHRSAALAVELAELMAASDADTHRAMSLKDKLDRCISRLSEDICQVMDILKDRKAVITSYLNQPERLKQELSAVVAEVSALELAGQGVYVTKSNGDIAGLAVPEGLIEEKRNELKKFVERPYFRQARTFRKPFVSDVWGSIYNKQATVFFCVPLGDERRFEGLLFAAAQPGPWSLPVELRDECWREKIEFVLVDSNGIAIVPPTYEMRPTDPLTMPEGEEARHNQGFHYERVQEISRRDVHILHIVQNVVPVGWDDDVHDVSPDLRLYSMVADVPSTRWKLALSRSVPPMLSKSA